MIRKTTALFLILTMILIMLAPTSLASKMGVVTSRGYVNMRSGAGDSPIVAAVKSGSSVEVIQKKGRWYHVKLVKGGKTGYIYQDYISFGAQSSKNVAVKLGYTGEMARTKTKIDLRASASSRGKKVATLPKGAKVIVSKASGSWYKVSVAGSSKSGYIPKKYISGGVPAVTTGKIYLRSGSSTSFGIIKTIPKGKGITVLTVYSSWSRVNYNGRIGYIKNEYFRLR